MTILLFLIFLLFFLIIYNFHKSKNIVIPDGDTLIDNNFTNDKSTIFNIPTSKLSQNDIINKSITRSNLNKNKVYRVNNDNINDVILSINDLYVYNPQAHTEMLRNIQSFYSLFIQSIGDHQISPINYGFMEQNKRNALNALMSVIHRTPSDPRINNKLSQAAKQIDIILSGNLDQISYLVDDYNHNNGININTIFPEYGPKPFNQYTDIFDSQSYEIY